MEYVIFIGIVVFVLILFAVLGIRQERQAKKTFLARMRALYGKLPDKKYTQENFRHIPTMFRKHETPDALDDITWNDLDMDAVFMRLNYCRSAAGEETLYQILRNPQSRGDGEIADESLFEEQVRFFSGSEEHRTKLQLLFESMRQTSKYSVYDHLDMLDKELPRSNARHFLMLGLIGLSIVLCFVRFEIFIAVLVFLLILNLLTYYREKGQIDAHFATFSYILRLISGADDLSKALEEKAFGELFAEETKKLRKGVKAMEQFRRGSALVMSTSQSTGGNPLEMLVDYLRIFTHADIIKFNTMYRHLSAHTQDVDTLNRICGAVEFRICVACFRASLKDAYCLPHVTENEETLRLVEGYHPLIQGAVPNTISCDKNVLLTGSNASGKSTFLKMTAINAVLAQSVHTVCAKAYQAPLYRIYSSMALSDNLAGGDSYYMVEIKSIKRILDAASGKGLRVLCFIDEVLRGTNTLERIAASAQILKQFALCHVRCFAATHDGELTGMLGDSYDHYHFDGEITDGDVQFDYRLREGSATTRNAIRLLAMLGYDDSIVSEAEKTAARFLESGSWV